MKKLKLSLKNGKPSASSQAGAKLLLAEDEADFQPVKSVSSSSKGSQDPRSLTSNEADAVLSPCVDDDEICSSYFSPKNMDENLARKANTEDPKNEDQNKRHCHLCGKEIDADDFMHWKTCFQQFRCDAEKSNAKELPCAVCKLELVHMTPEDRQKHAEECLTKNESKMKNFANKFECPFCGKTLEILRRASHLKRCAKQKGLHSENLVNIISLLDRQAKERQAVGIPPLEQKRKADEARRNGVNSRRYKHPDKLIPTSKQEADLQMAIALSASVQEEEKRLRDEELFELGVPLEEVPPVLNENQTYRIRKKTQRKAQKKKEAKKVSLLLLRSDADRQQMINEKVAAIIVSECNDARDHVLQNKENLNERQISSALLQQLLVPVSFLWNLSSLTGSEAEDLSSFYVPLLRSFVTPNKVKAGSKLRRLSSIPGRLASQPNSHKKRKKILSDDFVSSTQEAISAVIRTLESDADSKDHRGEISEEELLFDDDVLDPKHDSKANENQDVPTEPLILIDADNKDSKCDQTEITNETVSNQSNRDVFDDTGECKWVQESVCGSDGDYESHRETMIRLSQVFHVVCSDAFSTGLIGDYNEMVGRSELSDVRFRTKDRIVPGHCFVFYSRCRELYKAIAEEQRVNRACNVEPTEIDWRCVCSTTALEFLRFLYAGYVNDVVVSKKEIFYLLDKYDVTEIKTAAASSRIWSTQLDSSSKSIKFNRSSQPGEKSESLESKSTCNSQGVGNTKQNELATSSNSSITNRHEIDDEENSVCEELENFNGACADSAVVVEETAIVPGSQTNHEHHDAIIENKMNTYKQMLFGNGDSYVEGDDADDLEHLSKRLDPAPCNVNSFRSPVYFDPEISTSTPIINNSRFVSNRRGRRFSLSSIRLPPSDRRCDESRETVASDSKRQTCSQSFVPESHINDPPISPIFLSQPSKLFAENEISPHSSAKKRGDEQSSRNSIVILSSSDDDDANVELHENTVVVDNKINKSIDDGEKQSADERACGSSKKTNEGTEDRIFHPSDDDLFDGNESCGAQSPVLTPDGRAQNNSFAERRKHELSTSFVLQDSKRENCFSSLFEYEAKSIGSQNLNYSPLKNHSQIGGSSPQKQNSFHSIKWDSIGDIGNLENISALGVQGLDEEKSDNSVELFSNPVSPAASIQDSNKCVPCAVASSVPAPVVSSSPKTSSDRLVAGVKRKVENKQQQKLKKKKVAEEVTPKPAFGSMDTPQLRDRLKKNGIRQLKRKQAVLMLEHIYEATHPFVTDSEREESFNNASSLPSVQSSEAGPRQVRNVVAAAARKGKNSNRGEKKSVKLDLSQSSTTSSSSSSGTSGMLEESIIMESPQKGRKTSEKSVGETFEGFRKFFLADHELHKKTLRYEPLDFDELHTSIKKAGISHSEKRLMDYLDNEGITFTLRKNRWRKRQPKQARKKTKPKNSKESANP